MYNLCRSRCRCLSMFIIFFFKQKTAYEMRISDWSSDVCSSDLVRVVSVPCAEVFAQQDAGYRDTVLPPELRKRIAIEAGVSHYWRAFVGLDGDVIGVDTFGESAPASAVFKHFGFTVENLVERTEKLLSRSEEQTSELQSLI